MGGRHSDQYGCTKLLFTHDTQDLSKALLGASHNSDCWFVSNDCQLICWFVNYDTLSWNACFAARLAASSTLLRSSLAFYNDL